MPDLITDPVAPVDPNAAPAPAPVPAAPADPAPPIVDPVQNIAADGAVTFEPTGDLALDLSLEFFGKMGLTLESPELQEAAKGNFQYLEAKLAELGDKAKGHERFIALAKEAHGRLQSNEKASYEARKAVVIDAVGGEETWTQIQEFVKANAEPAELEEVKAALRGGGLVARATAEMLHRQYLSASGTTIEPASATRNQATANRGSPLTLAGYKEELNVLASKIGSSRLDGSPEYAALRQKYAHVKS